MPACSILLDSSSYFRLAQNIHPLLKVSINNQGACLGIIDELQQEYKRSPRLQHKFYWVNQVKYIAERKGCFKLTRKLLQEVELMVPFMKNYAIEAGLGVSNVDLTMIAYAYALKIPVVTDDEDMIKLAGEYKIKAFSTLEILKIMLDGIFIDMDIVRMITAHWKYQKDIPKAFVEDYIRIFGVSPP
jgi:hypothetical protein